MERVLELIREDIRDGFAQVNNRLDTLNGQTRRHGEAIAVLETRGLEARASADYAQEAIDQLGSNFSLHRARCPFDKESGNGNIEVFLVNKRRLAIVMAVVSGGVTAVIELVRYLKGM